MMIDIGFFFIVVGIICLATRKPETPVTIWEKLGLGSVCVGLIATGIGIVIRLMEVT
jgi:hypothetical protein